MKAKRCEVMLFHVSDSKPSLMIECKSLKQAREYIKDWLNAHSTKLYPFRKDGNLPDRYESKFSAIYIQEVK